MEVVKTLLRWYSYLFHAILGLFLLAVAVLALATGPHVLQLGMLPGSGLTLACILLFGSLLGLASAVLAFTGRLRLLFFSWSLVVAVVLLKGYMFGAYRFTPGKAGMGIELLAAAWLALVGAWVVMRDPAHSH